MALESGGITRWLWRVGASPGGFGEWGHLQVALESGGRVALESVCITRSEGIYRWLWRVWASPGVRVSPGGFGEWGHLQVVLESGGISRWFWRVGASPGGFGE